MQINCSSVSSLLERVRNPRLDNLSSWYIWSKQANFATYVHICAAFDEETVREKLQLRRHGSCCSSLSSRMMSLVQQTLPELPGIFIDLHLPCCLLGSNQAHRNTIVKINFCYLKREKQHSWSRISSRRRMPYCKTQNLPSYTDHVKPFLPHVGALNSADAEFMQDPSKSKDRQS